MAKRRQLLDEYRYPGCRPRATVKGVFGDPHVRVIILERRQKKQYQAVVARFIRVFTIGRYVGYGIWDVVGSGFTWKWRYAVYSAGGAAK